MLNNVSIFPECECSSNGSLSEPCHPVTGRCPCKPNVVGERCDQCLPGFYQPDPESEAGCQPCNCDLGGSTNTQCDPDSGTCLCRQGIEGRSCSEVRDDYFIRHIDYLRLEAEDTPGASDATVVADQQQNRFFTGVRFYRVVDGESEIDFGSLSPPVSGIYDVVIRYSLEGAAFWNSSVLTITPSAVEGEGEGPVDCGVFPEVTRRSSFVYANWMMGVGLSLTGTFCLRSGQSYGFTLGGFVSGRDDDLAVLSIDSLVLILVDSVEVGVFFDPVLSRDYRECVAMYRSLATQPPNPRLCELAIFSVSAEIYDGAARK